MAKILNIGSINVDHVYSVDHFIRAGETLAANTLQHFPGGKGLNQSVAMAYAGGQVCHGGKTGADGEWLVEQLEQAGVDVADIDTSGSVTGHAVIQVTPEGQNCILIYSGANFELSRPQLDAIFEKFSRFDFLVLQNEVNEIAYMMQKAHEIGMKIVFNPSPIGPVIADLPLTYVDYFILNEIEGAAMTGKTDSQEILEEMAALYPDAAIVLTIGKKGVLYRKGDVLLSHGVYDVPAVDTTAAGDTFTGYFVSSVAAGKPEAEALRLASVASSIAVSRAGASVSIPKLDEVLTSKLKPLA